MRSWSHRWVERILAFGGLAYWIVTTYLGLVFAAALLTSLTDLSTLRILAVLGLVLAAFAAMFMHRWRPRAARFAHLAMLGAAALTLGTCAEMVELPPQYASDIYRGVQIEYADEGVGAALPQVHDLIDQVYSRSGLPEPAAAVLPLDAPERGPRVTAAEQDVRRRERERRARQRERQRQVAPPLPRPAPSDASSRASGWREDAGRGP